MNTPSDVASGLLILVGTVFSFLAALGILRMPEFYMRVHAATKSATLGVSCLVLAAAIESHATGATTRALLVVLFLFLTAPVSAHMVGRAAHAIGIPSWEHSVTDEMAAYSGPNARPEADDAHPKTS